MVKQYEHLVGKLISDLVEMLETVYHIDFEKRRAA